MLNYVNNFEMSTSPIDNGMIAPKNIGFEEMRNFLELGKKKGEIVSKAIDGLIFEINKIFENKFLSKLSFKTKKFITSIEKTPN